MMNNFWNWWQHIPGRLNPVIFKIGGFKLQYYGLMYVVAFFIVYGLVHFRIKRERRFNVSSDQVSELMMNMIFGLIIGGRLGYVVFYNFGYYLKHPLEIFLPFTFSNGITFTGISGMSFHGGLIGIIFTAWRYVRKADLDFWAMADLCVPAIPLGYTFGRIGNFINGELYGRVTSASFGMIFPTAPGSGLRHPSQLYEAFFEGLFLFAVLWNLRHVKMPKGAMIALYLFGYGFVRFFIEFFRQPDAHIGFVFMSFSLGQIFCAVMMLCGFFVYLYCRRNEARQSEIP